MGRYPLLGRVLKVVGGLLALPLLLFFLFLVPFGPSVELLTSSTVLGMVGLAILGGLLFAIGRIIAARDSLLDSLDGELASPSEQTKEEQQLPPEQEGGT